ncbi:MAG: hypothetical protein RMY28_018590 [Nostoc sp. ChiSLP01]|nr:hypothetical protein [Nostoc sp. CmiSLP01]MDZ8287710.1 hypothetical protein [Nostoc sp. ChiSLP01]
MNAIFSEEEFRTQNSPIQYEFEYNLAIAQLNRVHERLNIGLKPCPLWSKKFKSYFLLKLYPFIGRVL